MPKVDDLLQEFPEKSRGQLQSMWQALPEAMRGELEGLLVLLPGDVKLWRMLLGMSLTQFKIAWGDKHTVAIVGPANAGKSTLYNQLVRAPADRALVSPVPGTTRQNQAADAGLFKIVDTPGADAVDQVGQDEKTRALDAAAAADFLVAVFDAGPGIRRGEQELYREFTALEKPMLVVLNKIDLVRRERDKVVERAAHNLGLEPGEVVPISAKDGTNVERVLLAIAKTEPEIVAALGRALPEFRWKLAWGAITGAASTAAVIALAPLPIVDVIPLLAIQSALVLSIARIYQYDLTFKRARELVVTFGLGFLGRTLFQELSKMGGPPGWLLAAAIASSTTAVMGYAAIMWFERGERLTGETLKEITKSVTTYLIDSLKSLGQRKPSQQSLQERISAILEKSPMAADPGVLMAAGNQSPNAGPPGETKDEKENIDSLTKPHSAGETKDERRRLKDEG